MLYAQNCHLVIYTFEFSFYSCLYHHINEMHLQFKLELFILNCHYNICILNIHIIMTV